LAYKVLAARPASSAAPHAALRQFPDGSVCAAGFPD